MVIRQFRCFVSWAGEAATILQTYPNKVVCDEKNLARHLGRAVILYLVQRTDCSAVTLAADIDPTYAAGFAEATAQGVEVLAFDCAIDPGGVSLKGPLPFHAP